MISGPSDLTRAAARTAALHYTAQQISDVCPKHGAQYAAQYISGVCPKHRAQYAAEDAAEDAEDAAEDARIHMMCVPPSILSCIVCDTPDTESLLFDSNSPAIISESLLVPE